MASARFVLFTHGLFGNPKPGPNRVYVNLWHGHGPKRTANNAYEARIPSDLLITNTLAWGRETAKSLGLDGSTVANIGNPRQDAMNVPPSAESLARLGLSNARHYVIWMPTYRRVSSKLAHNWRDAEPLSCDAASDQSLEELRAAIEGSGIDFRVKLHPMDADRLRAFSRWHVTDAEIAAARTSLYSLLGGAAGLISDYSSVWVEYLTLDRPLLLFCPDVESYDHGRGFKSPSMFDIASDLVVTHGSGVREFLENVKRSEDWQAAARRKAAESLQLCDPGRYAPRLVQVLADAAARKGLALNLRRSPVVEELPNVAC
jgi:CDP-glycerol glycerophosphotransferase (TagB/SpsB family)